MVTIKIRYWFYILCFSTTYISLCSDLEKIKISKNAEIAVPDQSFATIDQFKNFETIKNTENFEERESAQKNELSGVRKKNNQLEYVAQLKIEKKPLDNNSMLHNQNCAQISKQKHTKKKSRSSQLARAKKKKKKSGRETQYIGGLLKDALELHKNLFSWNSFKILTATFPFFVGARMIDERLQRCFYDETCHKNKRFMADWCHDVAQSSIAVPMLGLGTQMFFGKTEEMRETTRVFLLGIPFLIWAKDLIKKLRFDANLRPWHEKFSCEERAGGGFPSGHMAEAMYTATLYGMRFGPRFAIPLGGLAAFIGGTFVICNRHYISQIVAGAGLGVLYAVAADTLINTKLIKNIDVGVAVSSNGAPALSLSYAF